MKETLIVLLPYLKFAAGAGAGWIASILFDYLRWRYPHPAPWEWLDIALYAPRVARYSAWLLSVAIALPATAVIALIEGRDALPAIDASLAALLGMIFSQIRHGQTALSPLPFTPPAVRNVLVVTAPTEAPPSEDVS